MKKVGAAVTCPPETGPVCEIDEYTRECLATRVARQLTAEDVQDCLTELFCRHGLPEYVRCDNGPEFTADRIRTWLNELGTATLFIEPGSPCDLRRLR